jgi:mRNA interferase RelE/StbE
MASYRIQWEARAAGELRSIDRVEAQRILKAVTRLQDNPELGKQLRGRFKGFRRLRVGHHRVIYCRKKRELIILILRVAKRAEVYDHHT